MFKARKDAIPHSGDSQSGFALFDVLMALFLFSLGFAALYGLKEAAAVETRKAVMLNEAANLAQTQLEGLLAHSWAENLDSGRVIPGKSIEGWNGLYHVQILTAWGDLPWLLDVKVLVDWPEGRTRPHYELEGLYYVD